MKSILAILVLATATLVTNGLQPSNSYAEGPESTLRGSKRIAILGDSITYGGQYAMYLDLWLAKDAQARGQKESPRVINVGLPSETVSGLSEEGHAGGAFPRPDVAERLDRVLKTVKPDLVIACYGMNCGIYLPFDEVRFAKYQTGIRNLKEKVEESGAKCILMTPPFYDDQIGKLKFSYNEVLDRYSQWLLEQRSKGWMVVDLHTPMTQEVARRRQSDAGFTMQPDAVHPNDAGNWYIATQVLKGFGANEADQWKTPEEMVKALGVTPTELAQAGRRMQILRDAYLSAAGHLRPGIAKGLSIEAAEKEIAEAR